MAIKAGCSDAEARDVAQEKVPPDQFQIFDLYAPKGLPLGEVARLTRSSRAKVYVVKHRLSPKVVRSIGCSIMAEMNLSTLRRFVSKGMEPEE